MIGNNFTVYKHTSPNGKVYIGITMQNPIRRWNGCKTAGKALNIPYQNISECVKEKGRRKSAGGYLWRYENNGIE